MDCAHPARGSLLTDQYSHFHASGDENTPRNHTYQNTGSRRPRARGGGRACRLSFQHRRPCPARRNLCRLIAAGRRPLVQSQRKPVRPVCPQARNTAAHGFQRPVQGARLRLRRTPHQRRAQPRRLHRRPAAGSHGTRRRRHCNLLRPGSRDVGTGQLWPLLGHAERLHQLGVLLCQRCRRRRNRRDGDYRHGRERRRRHNLQRASALRKRARHPRRGRRPACGRGLPLHALAQLHLQHARTCREYAGMDGELLCVPHRQQRHKA